MDDLMTKFDGFCSDIEQLEKDLVSKKEEMGTLALEIKEAAGGKSSFEHAGKWYQVRKRGGKPYVCMFDVPPGSWLKKNKTKESDIKKIEEAKTLADLGIEPPLQ